MDLISELRRVADELEREKRARPLRADGPETHHKQPNFTSPEVEREAPSVWQKNAAKQSAMRLYHLFDPMLFRSVPLEEFSQQELIGIVKYLATKLPRFW